MTQQLIEYATARKNEGWKIVLVKPNSKIGTKHRNANQRDYTNHVINQGNLGGIPPRSIAIIDVDVHNANGYNSINSLNEKFSIADQLIPSVHTPTGGQHILLAVPQEYQSQLKSKIDFMPGLDLIYNNLYVVFPYSVREDGEYKLNYYKINEIDNSEFWQYLCISQKPIQQAIADEWTIGSRNMSLYKEAIKIYDTYTDSTERVNYLNELIQKAKKYSTSNNPFTIAEIRRTIESAERRYLAKVEILQNPDGSSVFNPSIEAAIDRFFHVRADDIVFVSEGNELHIMTWSTTKWIRQEDNLIALIIDNESEIIHTALKNNIVTYDQMNMYINSLYEKDKAKKIAQYMVPRYRILKKNNLIPKGIVEIPNYAVNTHDEWIIFKNCGVNLVTGDTIPIWETKSFHSTMTISYDYDESIKSSLIDEFVKGKESFFIAIAKNLRGGPCRDIGIVLGDTGTGKTTFSEVISNALEDYAMISSLSFLSNTEDPGKPDPPLIAACQGVRILLGSDVANYVKFNSASIKRIIGSEAISARELYKGTKTYRLSFTAFVSENRIPYTGISRDPAIASRIKFLQCNPFSTVMNIKELKQIKHYQALVNKLIDICIDKSVPTWSDQSEYQLEAIEAEWPDYIFKLEEDYEITINSRSVIETSDLYQMLKMYAPNISRRAMIMNLTAYFKQKFNANLIRSNGTRKWKGLKIQLKDVRNMPF